MSDLVERLRTKAAIMQAWEGFELGDEPPSKLGYWQTGEELFAAAEEIERLRAVVGVSDLWKEVKRLRALAQSPQGSE